MDLNEVVTGIFRLTQGGGGAVMDFGKKNTSKGFF